MTGVRVQRRLHDISGYCRCGGHHKVGGGGAAAATAAAVVSKAIEYATRG